MSVSTLGRVAVVVSLASCATIPPEQTRRVIATAVELRTGVVAAPAHDLSDAAIATQVAELLRGGLNPQRAVAIALVNNPELQAAYARTGIARADVAQATLVANPVVNAHVGFPLNEGRREYEVGIEQNVLDILLLPLRKAAAESELAAEVHQTSHDAVALAMRVRQALADVQAAVAIVALQTKVVDTEWGMAELALRQREAGNITELERVEERVKFELARADLSRDELEVIERREAVNRLLGLWGAQTEWTLASGLPDDLPPDFALEHLEALALRERLDVAAARQRVALFEKSMGVARARSAFGAIDVGLNYHRDPDGPQVLGPSLRLELPAFDRRQALLARLAAQRDEADRRLSALAVNVRSEVRLARARLVTAKQLAGHAQTILLPLRTKAVDEAQLQYNAMQIGPSRLLATRQEQLGAERAAVAARRDAWKAYAELELALGGRVAPVAASATGASSNGDQSTHGGHEP